MQRRSIRVTGVVQGVGFRPVAARLAAELALVGWVRNDTDGVEIEVQGSRESLDSFARGLCAMPLPAKVVELRERELVVSDDVEFRIVPSAPGVVKRPSLPADLATCAACLEEIFDPKERRYRYPFTNCTACGPRSTIVERLPYDRANTSMARFPLCADCRREYEDVRNRRYHAEPIACPRCGPRLSLVDSGGAVLADDATALERAVEFLRSGQIVALRGLGGFQLLVDAAHDVAVARLRERKHRPLKPLAVMFGDVEAVARHCELEPEAVRLLTSPAAPIVLLPKRSHGPVAGIAATVASGCAELGVLLPTTPLHHLLLRQFGGPVICTSGNLVDEPICIHNDEARQRLARVADVFLVHDRAVVRPMDDSIARVTRSGPEILRRARGFAWTPVARLAGAPPILALGAHYKSSVTLVAHGECVMSQHLGDLDTPAGEDLLQRVVDDLCEFYAVKPRLVACDLHPDYASSTLAVKLAAHYSARLVRVQHHHAHLGSLAASHGHEGKLAGLAWDGTGYGWDETIWGGELLCLDAAGCERLGHLPSFRLPGGDRAAREPWRSALGIALGAGLDPESVVVPDAERRIALRALELQLNAPLCSSVGRLFDAVAHWILGIARVSFEGEAAMRLEAVARLASQTGAYPMPFGPGMDAADCLGPLCGALLEDRRRGVDVATMARRFHEALVDWGVAQAEFAGEERFALAGGCFQNSILRERLSERLSERGFRVLTAEDVPVNDGGISLGQAWVAARLPPMLSAPR